MTNLNFYPNSDLDAYCFLKAHLKTPYSVEAKPSSDYFSEWGFHYVIYEETNIVDEFEGNFKSIQKGELSKWAEVALNKYGGSK